MKKSTKLFQHSTLAALMSGLYEGTEEIGKILEHGSFGIGTVENVDGELTVLDGKSYLAKATGEVIQISNDTKVPYAAVANHNTTVLKKVLKETTSMNLMNLVRNNLVSENLFHTVKVTGIFKYVKLRVSPGANPGETFGDVAARQPEFTKENISGTIVGIWIPELYSGMSLDGFHLHFLSDDKKFSGHIINLIMTEGIIEIGKIDQVIQDFPIDSKVFLTKNLDLKKIHKMILDSE